MPLHLGNVNCYLLKEDEDFFLIDTGTPINRSDLLRALEKNKCLPGRLKLIILTHGDFDHSGNAAFIRDHYRCQVAMHPDDAGVVSQGDMFFGRKKSNPVLGKLMNIFSGFGRSEHFVPDFLVTDGFDLTTYGFDARVISIPGHSPGSIGILTTKQDLFCGDLMVNINKPVLNSLIDDEKIAEKSMGIINELKINRVFPGHGNSFLMEEMKG